MKEDCWRNLFYFFRTRGNKDSRKEQLENNTTKSFLKVLRECPEQLTEAFFETLDIEISNDFDGYENFYYRNQVKPNKVKADIKYIVGVSNKEEPKNVESDKAEGVVDGVIEVSGNDEELALALEVKTKDDSLSGEQLGKYKNALDISEERLIFCRWQDIYDFFKKEEEQNYLKEKGKFLVREFKEYLDLMDMVPFQGFSGKACDFLKKYDDRAQEEVWKGKKKLLKEVKDKIIERDWYDSESWGDPQLKEHYRHKRRGFLKLWKTNWGPEKGAHYELKFIQGLASEGKMQLCFHIEKNVPSSGAGEFAERLAEKIEQKKIKQELIEQGYSINGDSGVGKGFLHRNFSVDFSKGNKTVNKIIDVIDELVEDTGLTECVDECIKQE